MTIEETIEQLERENLLKLGEEEYIWLGKLKTLIFSSSSILVDIQELKGYMKGRKEYKEISRNFFVLEKSLNKLLENVPKEMYKKVLEDRYIVEIEEKYLMEIVLEQGKSYEDMVKFGLENSYVEERWLRELDIDKTVFSDIYEVIQSLEDKGIRIKYDEGV